MVVTPSSWNDGNSNAYTYVHISHTLLKDDRDPSTNWSATTLKLPTPMPDNITVNDYVLSVAPQCREAFRTVWNFCKCLGITYRIEWLGRRQQKTGLDRSQWQSTSAANAQGGYDLQGVSTFHERYDVTMIGTGTHLLVKQLHERYDIGNSNPGDADEDQDEEPNVNLRVDQPSNILYPDMRSSIGGRGTRTPQHLYNFGGIKKIKFSNRKRVAYVKWKPLSRLDKTNNRWDLAKLRENDVENNDAAVTDDVRVGGLWLGQESFLSDTSQWGWTIEEQPPWGDEVVGVLNDDIFRITARVVMRAYARIA